MKAINLRPVGPAHAGRRVMHANDVVVRQGGFKSEAL